MTSRDFCYWLQGFFELSNVSDLSEYQLEMIKRHLNLVFKHEIDPSFGSDPTYQAELSNIHDGNSHLNPNYGDRLVKC